MLSKLNKIKKMVINSVKSSLKTKQLKQKRRLTLSWPLPKKRLELRRRRLTERKLKRKGLRKRKRLLPKGKRN